MTVPALRTLSRGAFVAAAILLAGGRGVVAAPETVKVTLPASVGFAVTNVSVSTTGSPSPTALSYASASLRAGHQLRISIKANSDFVPPRGTAIPAANVSWTTANAVGGTGSGGTLSTSAYTQLFVSNNNPNSGSVNVTWTLAAPGASIAAGAHALTATWKLESF